MKELAAGARLGILGGGQLGRMTALAAARLGCEVHVFCQSADEPAASVCASCTFAPFSDLAALAAFARSLDAVTLEWENIPLAALEEVARHTVLAPSARILEIAQDRGKEKAFAQACGVGTAAFEIVRSAGELEAALGRLGRPSVLKATRLGYDGHGQVTLKDGISAAQAWESMGSAEGILEAFVDFACEVSVLVARGADGVMRTFPVVENRHRDHILAQTHAPALLDPALEDEALALARRLAEELELTGLLAIEMFVLKAPDAQGNRVLMNEIAPRPHNSGHWTLDACACSQFEMLARAALGLPLVDPAPHSRAVMVNLLGEDMERVPELLTQPSVCLHLYGKKESRKGRKMGHVTFLKGPWPDKEKGA